MFDSRFVRFIRRHHVMTLATAVNGEPYCANVFYAFDEQSRVFVFSSESRTRHFREMTDSGFVAGSIVLETRNVVRIRGLQLQGRVYMPEGKELDGVRKRYLRRFPYAAGMKLSLWVLKPVFMKLTDNRSGFGNKLVWEAVEDDY